MRQPRQLALVCLFAVAMAWVEAATVVYLRMLLDRVEPYAVAPLPERGDLAGAELVREAATIAMFLVVGWLAGRDRRERLGYFLVAFGVWDIVYYISLALIVGWPDSLLDWDVLFLIPLPWWGPVLAPISIAAILAAAGTLTTQFSAGGTSPWPSSWSRVASAGGVLLALLVFMTDALKAAPQGMGAVRNVRPESFNWPLFGLTLTLLAVPVVDLIVQVVGPRLLPLRRSPR